MLHLSSIYRQHEPSSLDCVYKALRNKDLADCVVTAYRVLKQTNNIMKFKFKEKSITEAFKHGIDGKEAFCKGEYQISLVKYNMALMCAPANSEAMRLSYYGRAELLLKTKQFQACVKDVETCLSLNCPASMVHKLREMKEEASRFTWIEQLTHQHATNQFTEEFFTLKGIRNPDIPCATSHVEVIMESGQPKVVAARDIATGTVVAVETAFVGATNLMNHVTSCHYCHKMDFNVMPCEGCCSAMFCDKQCKDKSMQDGHNIECKIIDFILDDFILPVKATLKIRKLCSSWDEFIKASDELGVQRMENSTFTEIFGYQRFSLLNSHYDTHFIYGAMFNRCLFLTNIIHYLDIHTSFLPETPEEKSAAIRAVGRVMMHLSLHCNPVQLQHYTLLCTEGNTTMHNHPNKGYFPFLGNLPNSCMPNSYVVGLRNSAALITTTPVKKGAEITFSYIGYRLDLEEVPKEMVMRARNMFIQYRTVCKDCVVCGGGVDDILLNSHLSNPQKKAFRFFLTYISSERNYPEDIKKVYKEICKILSILSDAPLSKEYVSAFISFMKCLMYCVQYKFPNVIMSRYK